MKNTERPNLIRQKHSFLYHGKQFFCSDLTVEDYLLISIDTMAGFEKVLLEHNDEIPKLNARQSTELMRILFGGKPEEKTVFDALTDTQKQIEAHKSKSKKKEAGKDIDEMLQDFHIIEGQMMHYLHQPLSELRRWPYLYFMKIYRDLPYCTGAKEYEKNRNSQSPDKAEFKKEFRESYT